MRRSFAALLLLSSIACARKQAPEPPVVKESPKEVASTASSTPPSPLLPKGPANLLHLVPAKVAVSSTVQNPQDFPEHVMDGRADTAWNGKTGDLKGAWIAFRVPRDARVERVEITAGFDKKEGGLDLFTANHRIKKLSIYRDGAKLKDAVLDVARRDLQSIPIDADGGDFKLEVEETLPGTKKEWREVVVSELLVVGKPGKELRKPGEPIRIAIGDLDAVAPKLPPVRYATGAAQKGLEAVCAAWIAENTATDETSPKPTCTPLPTRLEFKGDATYKNVWLVQKDSHAEPDYGPNTSVVLELARGFVMTDIIIGASSPGCASIWSASEVVAARVENGHFVAEIDGYIPGLIEDPKLDHGQIVRGVSWCRDDGKELVCKHQNPQYADGIAYKKQPRGPRRPWEAIPWTDVKKYRITPAGQLEFL